ncbi:hypothetical protein K402DRAFT_125899 [Aulographum hederae CBS 113979]|uniref:CFEM domain-containing protein n=1 Tax=Aulographum hederae CBS 113979 TaxID=1176131 RepID=A0A6G1HEG4_9PEZI|nr:hypothetical protein K402DRAFT_125899 [Aulographum hederae CBS 113979]
MKYSIALLVTGAALAVAQTGNDCANLCIGNMLALAGDIGCDDASATCLCGLAAWGRGLNDCSNEACGSGSEGNVAALSYGSSYCSCKYFFDLKSTSTLADLTSVAALASATSGAPSSGLAALGGAGGSGSSSAGSAGSGSSTPATVSAMPSSSAVGTGGAGAGGSTNGTAGAGGAGGSGSAITTSAIVSTITSGGSEIPTTLGSTTIYGGAGGAGGSGGAGGASSTGGSGGEGGEGGGESTSTGAGAFITAVPMVGAGAMAALMFL